jgi:ribosomal protein L37E
LLDSGAFNPGLTRPPEVVCAIDPHAGAETPESSKRKRPQPYFCKDCGRRFYNIGWHCEACGSSNYEPVADELAFLDQIKDGVLRATFLRAYVAWRIHA